MNGFPLSSTSSSTFAIVLALGVPAAPVPTIAAQMQEIERVVSYESLTPSALISNKQTDAFSYLKLTNQTVTNCSSYLPIESNSIVVTARATSDNEKIIGELRSWQALAANWDGEGAEQPLLSGLADAALFVQLLTPKIASPDPMLHATGRSGLFWKSEDIYADLEFFGNGRMAYYIEKNGDKHKGSLLLGKKTMPEVLSVLLQTTTA